MGAENRNVLREGRRRPLCLGGVAPCRGSEGAFRKSVARPSFLGNSGNPGKSVRKRGKPGAPFGTPGFPVVFVFYFDVLFDVVHA